MANYILGGNFSGNKKGGIYNTGKDTKIVGNTFINQDNAIVNTGKNMHAESNLIITTSNDKTEENLWTKWWMKYLIYPLVVTIISSLIVWYITIA